MSEEIHVLFSEIMVVFSSNIVILPGITERGWALVVCDRVHEFKLCEIRVYHRMLCR